MVCGLLLACWAAASSPSLGATSLGHTCCHVLLGTAAVDAAAGRAEADRIKNAAFSAHRTHGQRLRGTKSAAVTGRVIREGDAREEAKCRIAYEIRPVAPPIDLAFRNAEQNSNRGCPAALCRQGGEQTATGGHRRIAAPPPLDAQNGQRVAVFFWSTILLRCERCRQTRRVTCILPRSWCC